MSFLNSLFLYLNIIFLFTPMPSNLPTNYLNALLIPYNRITYHSSQPTRLNHPDKM